MGASWATAGAFGSCGFASEEPGSDTFRNEPDLWQRGVGPTHESYCCPSARFASTMRIGKRRGVTLPAYASCFTLKTQYLVRIFRSVGRASSLSYPPKSRVNQLRTIGRGGGTVIGFPSSTAVLHSLAICAAYERPIHFASRRKPLSNTGRRRSMP